MGTTVPQLAGGTFLCDGGLQTTLLFHEGVDLPIPDDTALIVRGVLRLSRRLRAERPDSSVSLSALGILSTLHRSGPMPAARLAQAERLQPQSLSRLIADLLQGGRAFLW